jgi:hypothetical protein
MNARNINFAHRAFELATGYAGQIAAADEFNTKLGGTDSLIGRGAAMLAQELVYVPLTGKAWELTTQNIDKASASFNAGNPWEGAGNTLTAFAAGVATAHMASRVVASVVTVAPGARAWLEDNGLV